MATTTAVRVSNWTLANAPEKDELRYVREHSAVLIGTRVTEDAQPNRSLTAGTLQELAKE
jgi:hypothetical protein